MFRSPSLFFTFCFKNKDISQATFKKKKNSKYFNKRFKIILHNRKIKWDTSAIITPAFYSFYVSVLTINFYTCMTIKKEHTDILIAWKQIVEFLWWVALHLVWNETTK